MGTGTKEVSLIDEPLTRSYVERLLRLAGSSDRLNLSGRNLSKIDLSEFNLTKTNLIGANLTQANLTNAILTGANLKQANLANHYSCTCLERACPKELSEKNCSVYERAGM